MRLLFLPLPKDASISYVLLMMVNAEYTEAPSYRCFTVIWLIMGALQAERKI
jgi:hypothetical protein